VRAVTLGVVALLSSAAPSGAELLPIRRYTTADGLAAAHVSRILQDQRGFLWFATNDGLSRFDGHRFVRVGREEGLPTAAVADVLETDPGVYWVATGAGVARCQFERRAARGDDPAAPAPACAPYRLGPTPAVNRVLALYRDRAGRLWAGSEGGLFVKEGTGPAGTFARVDLPAGIAAGHVLDVRAFAEDVRGNLWIGTTAGLIRRTPAGEMARHIVDPTPSRGRPDAVFALLADRRGRLWVGHSEGLAVLSPAGTPELPATTPFPRGSDPRRVQGGGDGAARLTDAGIATLMWYGDANDSAMVVGPVRSLCEAADGRIWMASLHGLIVFDGTAFVRWDRSSGLGDEAILALHEDRDRNLWFGTDMAGAGRLMPSGFSRFTEDDGLTHPRIASVFESRDGHLTIVAGDALHQFDGRRLVAIRPAVPSHIRYRGWGWYQVSFQDREGEWWIPTGEGLCRFARVDRLDALARRPPRAVYTTRDGLAGNDIFRLYEDARGDIWISSLGPRPPYLTRWERATGRFHRYDASTGAPDVAATAFREDRAGQLWVGFYDGRIARYDPMARRFHRLAAADDGALGLVRDLHLDDDGRLWAAGTRGGVLRIDDPTAADPSSTRYGAASGLASDTVRAITSDRWGRVYVATVRGIDRLDPRTGALRRYGPSEGLPDTEMNVAWRDRAGVLWFGTLQGLARLVPVPDRPVHPPTVFLDSLVLGGVAHRMGPLGEPAVAGLALPSGTSQVEIGFFAIAFAPGVVLRYQHRLDGADATWRAPSDERRVTFAHLAPGRYRFVVRAVTSDGAVSATPASVAFEIPPPLWLRWWFVALCAASIFAAGWTFHHRRIARALEMERMRTRIASDLHDDIGSSLARLAIISDVVQRKLRSPDAEIRHLLEDMADLARRQIDALGDVVWAIDPRADDVGNLAARINAFASQMLESRGIAYVFHGAPAADDCRLSANARRQILLILKEAITNVVRHAQCRTASLTIAVDACALRVNLHDDGRGLEPDARLRPGRGLGLDSMRARAHAIGGALEIVSSPGQGTRVTMTLPWRRRMA
jgi:signal transduction histidine kinase/ligand-binding sensor domain-containing protein